MDPNLKQKRIEPYHLFMGDEILLTPGRLAGDGYRRSITELTITRLNQTFLLYSKVQPPTRWGRRLLIITGMEGEGEPGDGR